MGEKQINKLVFIGITPYPNGLASTNRLVGLLKELPSLGWDVKVICLSSTKYPTRIENGKLIYDREGYDDGVYFKYVSATVKASDKKIFRTMSLLWGIVTFPFWIGLLLDSNRSDTKILLTNLTNIHYIVFLKLLSLCLKFRFVLLRSEYPYLNRTLFSGISKYILERWIIKFFDGFALMTYTLKNYFLKFKNSEAQIEIIPMTVEISRFEGKFESPFPFEYIAYAGSLDCDKDGIDILLQSFMKIAATHQDIHLVIMGDLESSKDLHYIMEILNSVTDNISRRILFTGLVNRSEIPRYLNGSKVLTLARPNSKQAEGGFPTKLGEYLATGKPVVVTATGEVDRYLNDNVHAFLSKPGSIDDFAARLDYVLTNYSHARVVGVKGKLLAYQVFNSQKQAEKLSEFLQR